MVLADKNNVDPKAIQQMEFAGRLEKLNANGNATNIGANQNIFVFSQGSVAVLWKWWGSKIWSNKNTTKLIKICGRKKSLQQHYK